MTKRDRIDWLLAAINAVEDLVAPKLEARRKNKAENEQHQELQICMEELRVAAEELTGLRDRLAVERQRYADLFDFAPEAYLETDAYGNIREANRAAAQLLHCAPEHLVGKPLAIFVNEDARRDFRAKFAALEAKGAGGPVDWQSRMQTRDGEPLDILMRASAARDAAGRLAGVRCMLRAGRGAGRAC